MLAPSEHRSRHLRPRPLRQSLRAVVVIAAAVLGVLILFFATEGLFLLAHYAHHDRLDSLHFSSY
jgi:hypothetical protein